MPLLAKKTIMTSMKTHFIRTLLRLKRVNKYWQKVTVFFHVYVENIFSTTIHKNIFQWNTLHIHHRSQYGTLFIYQLHEKLVTCAEKNTYHKFYADLLMSKLKPMWKRKLFQQTQIQKAKNSFRIKWSQWTMHDVITKNRQHNTAYHKWINQHNF